MPRRATDPLEELFTAFPALVERAATPAERDAFRRYADILIFWNRTHRLTAFKTLADIGRGLFLDALLFRAVLPAAPLRVLDIGSGAGIPGVPLRIVEPGLALTLIEARRKPVSFLRALTRELAMPDVRVYQGRAETLISQIHELSGKFDIVLARAVGLGPGLIETAMGYLKTGGIFIASGPPVGSPVPRISWRGSVEWQIVEFPRIGRERTFLRVTKGD